MKIVKRILKGIIVTLFNLLIIVLVGGIGLLSFSLAWAKENFAGVGMDEILFHINMPLRGTNEEMLVDFWNTAAVPALVLFVCFVILYIIFYTIFKKGFKVAYILTILLGITTSSVYLINSADEAFAFNDFVKSQLKESKLIEEEYVAPKDVEIKFPEKKRNLIHIVLESAETSAQDYENGGLFEYNYIPEMTELARDNISFSQSEKLEGATVAPSGGWTIAGLVSETSGIPLKLLTNEMDNSMNQYEYFLPGVTSIGEILKDEGYRNYFLCGSDVEFGGRAQYFRQHGEYTLLDINSMKAEGRLDPDYHVWWGYEDKKLYQYAKEELMKISTQKEPFNFTMLTVDTHHPDGYVCEDCWDQWGNQYANVWSCGSRQVAEFVEWIKGQDFYKDTTIVITGDHCSMDVEFYGDVKYDKYNGSTERKVYNAIINSPIQPVSMKNRRFTTLDFFPTTLAALGVKIEGDRLGLGTNLFSSTHTLSETYGYETLFSELNMKSSFYDKNFLYSIGNVKESSRFEKTE